MKLSFGIVLTILAKFPRIGNLDKSTTTSRRPLLSRHISDKASRDTSGYRIVAGAAQCPTCARAYEWTTRVLLVYHLFIFERTRWLRAYFVYVIVRLELEGKWFKKYLCFCDISCVCVYFVSL